MTVWVTLDLARSGPLDCASVLALSLPPARTSGFAFLLTVCPHPHLSMVRRKLPEGRTVSLHELNFCIGTRDSQILITGSGLLC